MQLREVIEGKRRGDPPHGRRWQWGRSWDEEEVEKDEGRDKIDEEKKRRTLKGYRRQRWISARFVIEIQELWSYRAKV